MTSMGSTNGSIRVVLFDRAEIGVYCLPHYLDLRLSLVQDPREELARSVHPFQLSREHSSENTKQLIGKAFYIYI